MDTTKSIQEFLVRVNFHNNVRRMYDNTDSNELCQITDTKNTLIRVGSMTN